MPSIFMPDLTAPLATHHTGPYWILGAAFLVKELAIERIGNTRHDVAANALLNKG
jgi:hypothetical protein